MHWLLESLIVFAAASAIDVFMVMWYAAAKDFRYVRAMVASVIVAALSFVSFTMSIRDVYLVVPYLLGNAVGTALGIWNEQRKKHSGEEK
jgi:multidrug transporter EmrE-like cation transporter